MLNYKPTLNKGFASGEGYDIERILSNKFKKKIPFFPLDDCIVTTESTLSTVFEFMKTTFEVELGFVPVLNPKLWD